MKPDARRVEGGADREASMEPSSEADVVLDQLAANARCLGPGWLDETLVVLAGLKRFPPGEE
jgi:hypothetical protein